MPTLAELKKDKAKLRAKKKQIDSFIKEVRKAKADGYKSGKFGNKKDSIQSLIHKGIKAKKEASIKSKKIDKAIAKKRRKT